MKSTHILLDETERQWRPHVHRDFPLRANTPVIKNSKPNGRDWEFSTDLRQIFATISNDDNLKKKFEKVVTKFWKGNPEDLTRETLHYLLWHELYHPIEAPFSTNGDDNDNKKIHQAIRKGVLKAEPKLSPLEQMTKVMASQNGVKDFILDNRFYLDNQQKGYVQEDIIPVWDLIELDGQDQKTNFYTITRFLYGTLYGNDKTHEFFEDKTGKDGVEVAEKSLTALIGTEVELPKSSIGSKLMSLVGKGNDSASLEQRLNGYSSQIRGVFAGEDRYSGIERMMSVLAPYIEKNMPQGRPDMQGAGSGGSPQDILQDLLDDMTPEEQEQFTQGLEQEGEGTLEQLAQDIQAQLGQNPKESSQEGKPSDTDMLKNLDLLATHEFYKRNHPRVSIVGGSKVGESVVVGKREHWHLQRSNVITQDQLGRLNLRRLDSLQKKSKLPWLIDLGNGTYRLNEYELKEKDIKDVVYRDSLIDVPDIVEFYLDSSGSMFGYSAGDFKVNDGGRWDMLCHVLYGFVDALEQGGREVRKTSKLRFHNFSDSQKSSEIITASEFWQNDTESLKILYRPKNGYHNEDINITDFQDGQKRAYVVVTDGQLVIDGRANREAEKMKTIARNSNNSVVHFEIGGTYDLGQAVQSDPNIAYMQVHDKNKMLQAGLEVLIGK